MKPRICMLLLAGAAVCAGQAPDPASTGKTAYVPLTQTERFHRYVHGMFSVEALLRTAAGSGFTQWSDTPSEWGQGMAGYARRYGNSYAQHVMRQTISYGIASVIDEDNRYIRSDHRQFGGRLRYAIDSTFMARRSDGRRRISYSRISAVVATAFISREWQPHTTNGAQNALNDVAVTFGTEVGFNVVREFLPSLLHH